MYRVDAVYRKQEQTYLMDSQAALDLAAKLANTGGITLYLLNIYDEKEKLVYHFDEKERRWTEDGD